ncbi:small guanosine triphosphatase family (GTPase)-like Ras family protein (macronuclear) [Tetrahymena thermophila SB210]|uniref:Small guanosine triphosphatase family (GTPase)-like Ras family protein n=1 Tax=Tetrahymena thermophila (strain SB210) TaxID=312017 RepID=I7MH79_TETTS|nr:small guanosine triphosphatase family (GTPase)-like Ras family protein [Tetrahymena thermophila SB210]EAS02678.2 small guanosine triphosphatase family (GTPase)-like Ras family protein [Tetrahymena thermophila SB210]|eukprot:XP_001022923.2 small guanosine triphosphatase family (GTPase)-like Ras family protein [Tetrahymena thermophila SB210]
MNQYDYLFKFIIIGNTSVGKSCILSQFTENRFKREHDATIGVEFGSKNIEVDGYTIKIQIWDTAGQESFRSITRSYYRGSVGALLVYDVTKEDSFQDLNKWISDVSENANKDLSVAVLGNKIDLDNREVKAKDGEAFASERNFLFFETSALNGDNIGEAFYALAKHVLDRIIEKQIDLTDQVIIIDKQKNIVLILIIIIIIIIEQWSKSRSQKGKAKEFYIELSIKYSYRKLKIEYRIRSKQRIYLYIQKRIKLQLLKNQNHFQTIKFKKLAFVMSYIDRYCQSESNKQVLILNTSSFQIQNKMQQQINTRQFIKLFLYQNKLSLYVIYKVLYLFQKNYYLQLFKLYSNSSNIRIQQKQKQKIYVKIQKLIKMLIQILEIILPFLINESFNIINIQKHFIKKKLFIYLYKFINKILNLQESKVQYGYKIVKQNCQYFFEIFIQKINYQSVKKNYLDIASKLTFSKIKHQDQKIIILKQKDKLIQILLRIVKQFLKNFLCLLSNKQINQLLIQLVQLLHILENKYKQLK